MDRRPPTCPLTPNPSYHVYASAGASSASSTAVELEPAGARYWKALGSAGRFAEAEGAFREALDPADPRHAYNLGLALVRQGRSAAARPLFESALKVRPDFQPARDRLSELAATAPGEPP